MAVQIAFRVKHEEGSQTNVSASWGAMLRPKTRIGLLRYYNPATGRWPSRDPIEESGGENHYRFCSSDPVNRIDPRGLLDVVTTYPSTSPPAFWEYLPNTLQGGYVRFSFRVRCNAGGQKTNGEKIPPCKVACTIDVEITSSGIILNSNFQGRMTVSQAYGHEQKHITSVIGQAEKIKADLSQKNEIFQTIDDAKKAAQEYEKPYRSESGSDSTQQYLNKEANHGNPNSPRAGTAYNPLPGSPNVPPGKWP